MVESNNVITDHHLYKSKYEEQLAILMVNHYPNAKTDWHRHGLSRDAGLETTTIDTSFFLVGVTPSSWALCFGVEFVRSILDPHPNFLLISLVILIGDVSVGKTCLLSRFLKDSLPKSTSPTIGVEFATKNVTMKDGATVKA